MITNILYIFKQILKSKPYKHNYNNDYTFICNRDSLSQFKIHIIQLHKIEYQCSILSLNDIGFTSAIISTFVESVSRFFSLDQQFIQN